MTTDELLQRWSDGSITADELRELTAKLAKPEHQSALLDDWLLESSLPDRLPGAAVAGLQESAMNRRIERIAPVRAKQWAVWLSWRPLTAAAAGIVFGMFCTSVVFAYVVPSIGNVVTLLRESFESGPPPLVTGIPVKAGHWSGDYSEVVGEYRGVKPPSGAKMLRFLRADYKGKPGRDGYVGDVFRIIDLSGSGYDVARGDACVSVESRFFSLPQDVPGPALCSISIHALDALPTQDERLEFMEMGERARAAVAGGTLHSGMTILATAVRNARLEATHNSWEVVRSELRLPPGARFLLVHLSLLDPRGPQAPQPREFAGLFVDDVRVTLTHRPPLP